MLESISAFTSMLQDPLFGSPHKLNLWVLGETKSGIHCPAAPPVPARSRPYPIGRPWASRIVSASAGWCRSKKHRWIRGRERIAEPITVMKEQGQLKKHSIEKVEAAII
jgi:hypothetical protein